MLSGLEQEEHVGQQGGRSQTGGEQGSEGSTKQGFGVSGDMGFVEMEGDRAGMARCFVTCAPLHKECNGNPEPSKDGRRKER